MNDREKVERLATIIEAFGEVVGRRWYVDQCVPTGERTLRMFSEMVVTDGDARPDYDPAGWLDLYVGGGHKGNAVLLWAEKANEICPERNWLAELLSMDSDQRRYVLTAMRDQLSADEFESMPAEWVDWFCDLTDEDEFALWIIANGRWPVPGGRGNEGKIANTMLELRDKRIGKQPKDT